MFKVTYKSVSAGFQLLLFIVLLIVDVLTVKALLLPIIRGYYKSDLTSYDIQLKVADL